MSSRSRTTTTTTKKHGHNYCGIEKHEQVENKDQQQKSTVIIAGDSIVKNLNGWMMHHAKRVKVRSFSGAITTETKHFIDPFLKRHRLVNNGGFPKFKVLYCSLNVVSSFEVS